MKKMSSIAAVLCAYISLASGAPGAIDSLGIEVPMHFTANAGQWDESVRYALLGGESTIWFCDNEIVFTKPMVSKNSAIAEQSAPTGNNALDVIRLGFPSTSNRRRVEALDTLIGTAHFYHGSDSISWRKNVTTHRAICYRNIADGLDLEIDLETPINLLDSSDPTDGKLSLPNVRFVANGKPASANVPVVISVNGTQRTLYLDCSELHSYLAVSGFDDLTTYHQVQVEGDFAYLWGVTRSPVFPTRNAYQPTLNGDWDAVYIKYSIRNRRVVYSTYLGSPNPEVGWGSVLNFSSNSLIAARNGKLFAAIPTPLGFPITTVIPGTVATKRNPAYALVVFVLDRDGMLDASAYLGGPGRLEPCDIRVHNDRVYLFSTVIGDSLRQITDDALEPTAVFRPEPSNDRCGYLAVLNMQIDSLIYGTYIDPSTLQGRWLQHPVQKMDVAADGTVFIARTKMTFEHSKNILVNPAFLPDSLNHLSAYIIAIAPDLHHYTYATWFGFADRAFVFQNLIPLGDHELYFTGYSMIDPVIGSVAASPFIHRFDVPDGCRYGIVVGHLGASGSLVNATEICSNAYTPYCSGFFESYCGSLVWAGTGVVTEQLDSVQFALINPFDSRALAMPPMWSSKDNILIELKTDDLEPLYCSYWNHRFSSQLAPYTQVTPRPNGWVYYSSTPGTPEVPDWYMLGNPPDQGFYAADVRIPTPCWTILCDLRTIDTIHVERRRGYFDPVEFNVDYSVSNASAAKGARILRSWITIPDGLALVAGADTQAMSPSLIGPGESASAFWRVRVTDPSLLGDTASIRCRVMYVDPESGYDYPAPEELCVKEILVVPYDEPDPLLECVIDGPDSLYWQSPGLATSSTGAPGLARYTITITNRDIDPVPIASFHLRMREHCSIIGDTVRPGLTLAPGSSHIIIVEVDVDALRFSREIVLEAEAWDLYDLVIHSCRKETFVPGALDLYCSTRGTTRIEWYPASGIAIPSSVMVNIDLENPLDTVRSSVSVHADLAAAPHLTLLPGDSLVRGPFDVTSSGVKSPSWRFAFTNPPSVNVDDTIVFTYGHDGLVGQCMHIISIEIVDKSVLCSLAAADTVSEAEVLSHAPVALQYVLRNIGTVPVTVDRYELTISPGAGLATDDPLLRPGGMIAQGTDIQLNWSLRSLILRTARVATCTVTAYVGDSVLSVCTADIFLPGIDGLRCAIAATDTVRFERDSLRYNPDPVPVQLDLSNVLDTEETAIEAEIDLANAPRFELAAGENALKTLAIIDSHATAGITWLLTPQPGPTDKTQDIRIRYRSIEQGVWEECEKLIIIEAWPEIAEVLCETGGHDSLHADAKYEDIIPKPFEISYTATNSGTVTLTNCEAAIILPAGFALAGSDSIQSFGTIAPGESAKRWWMLTPSDQLPAFGLYQFNWQWSSDEQGTVTGCAHTVQLVPEASGGIVFTPLHLYFEAELGGTLPAAQNIQLWTGNGLSMPWTTQSDTWYIDLDPVTGDHAATIAVRPNTTMLNKGLHTSAIELAGSAQNLPKQIEVEYLITSLTSSGNTPAPSSLSLGPVYPHPISLQGEARLVITSTSGSSARITLHDLLGRERGVLHDGVITDSEVLILRPAALGLEPGSYLLRLLAPGGMQSRMVTVVR